MKNNVVAQYVSDDDATQRVLPSHSSSSSHEARGTTKQRERPPFSRLPLHRFTAVSPLTLLIVCVSRSVLLSDADADVSFASSSPVSITTPHHMARTRRDFQHK